MKCRLALAVWCWISLVSTSLAETGIISVNLYTFASELNQITDDQGETFGVPAESSVAGGWINVNGGINPGTMIEDLTLSNGVTSTVDIVRGNNPGGLNVHGGATWGDTAWRSSQLIFSDTGNRPFIDLAGLNETFTSYKIIAYLAGFNMANNQGSIQLVAPDSGSSISDTFYWTVPNPFDATPLLTTDTIPGDGVDVANYAVFDNRTEDTISIEWNSFNAGVGLGGFQIVGELALTGPITDVEPDGDVDGADFLELQRSNPALISTWESEYGTAASLASATHAVPEPSSIALLAFGWLFRRRGSPR